VNSQDVSGGQLEQAYLAVSGITGLDPVYAVADDGRTTVTLRVYVEQGYNTQAMAEILRFETLRVLNVSDVSVFLVTLSDGISRTDYLKNNFETEWRVTEVENEMLSVDSTQYYAQGTVNVRACARTDCAVIMQLGNGQSLTIIGMINGEAVETGNLIWYVADLGGAARGYVYSGLMTLSPPPAATSAPSAGDDRGPRPGNCSTAVAMGLSAQEAAQWPHLDGDDDGVACYGN
jgi:hypothetical protein